MVDERAHVLRTFFSPFVFMSRTFSCSFASMNGPFFNERDIYLCSPGRLAAATAAHDQLVRSFLSLAGLHALRLAPRRDRRTTTRCLAFATTERMIDWIHRNAAHLGTLTAPTICSRLANHSQLMVGITNFADRGQTFGADHTHFARRHAQRDVAAFLGDDLRAVTG